jgi:spermidine synthase
VPSATPRVKRTSPSRQRVGARVAAPGGSIEVSEEAGVRYLHFGSSWIQGAMRLARPHALELEYTRDMMFPLLLEPPEWPGRVLQIGLGAASITKFLHRHRKEAELVVVEIDARVVTAAQTQFRLPAQATRVAIEIGDGAAYVAAPGPGFDWIVVDGFDARGLAGALDTAAFYRHCRARLREGGLFVTNLLRRTRGCAASVARLRAAFDGRVLALPECASGNTIVIAATGSRRRLERHALVQAAATLRTQTGLNLARTVGRLAAVTPRGGRLAL